MSQANGQQGVGMTIAGMLDKVLAVYVTDARTNTQAHPPGRPWRVSFGAFRPAEYFATREIAVSALLSHAGIRGSRPADVASFAAEGEVTP